MTLWLDFPNPANIWSAIPPQLALVSAHDCLRKLLVPATRRPCTGRLVPIATLSTIEVKTLASGAPVPRTRPSPDFNSSIGQMARIAKKALFLGHGHTPGSPDRQIGRNSFPATAPPANRQKSARKVVYGRNQACEQASRGSAALAPAPPICDNDRIHHLETGKPMAKRRRRKPNISQSRARPGAPRHGRTGQRRRPASAV